MKTCMDYSDASAWILRERAFDPELIGKTESVMCLGNGYMGIRSAAEEAYVGEKRGCYIAGSYDRADETEVTEIPNAADCIQMDLYLDGERFALDRGSILQYEKSLNLRNGELARKLQWRSPSGRCYALEFYRMVSLADLHVIGQKAVVTPLTGPASLRLRTGINGQATNGGVQHFEETQKRFYENRYMQYVQTTRQSRIGFVWNAAVTIESENRELPVPAKIFMGRRKVLCEYEAEGKQGVPIVIRKISNVYTTRDRDREGVDVGRLQTDSLDRLKAQMQKGYDRLLLESGQEWGRFWEQADIRIRAEDPFDQLAVRFAQYHIRCMTPAQDARMSIGAKGLSGEGYKGHVFWDTDIFLLPFYSLQFPEIARNLVTYRALGLDGARQKARDGGYRGAQYPWEAAWAGDGEATPSAGDVDIITGAPQVIWTGKIEQHITADVIYGLWQYYECTQDESFLEGFGYEMIFETASFWASRLEPGEDGNFHINDVIGPDEYKEHVNDNAYTNYMAYWNIELAVSCCEKLRAGNFGRWEELDQRLRLQEKYLLWKRSLDLLYLPVPRSDGVIPQDASYLSLREIDLTKYKNQDFVLGIYRDYNAEQLNRIQVSKQADILLLFYLLEHYFTQEVKAANWEYYEPKTLHDSSLSLSTHCILANDMENREMAKKLFRKLCSVDMGPGMKTSDEGIHAASLGGIWQSVVFGFAGLRIVNGELRIRPHLPQDWEEIQFSFVWRQIPCHFRVDRNEVRIEKLGEQEALIPVEVCGKKYGLKDKLIVKYGGRC